MGRRRRRGAAAALDRRHHPRILRSVYGDRLRSLRELLIDLLAGQKASSSLIQDDDPPDFRSLMHESYAALPPDAPAMGAFSLEQRWSQEEVVERAIELQFRRKERPSHVLCFGYQKPHPNASSAYPLLRSQNVQCVVRNSMVDIVSSRSWNVLHSRIGDEVMLYLLSHAAIFTGLSKGCYMQVSGPQITYPVKLDPAQNPAQLKERNAKRKRKSLQQNVDDEPRKKLKCSSAEAVPSCEVLSVDKTIEVIEIPSKDTKTAEAEALNSPTVPRSGPGSPEEEQRPSNEKEVKSAEAHQLSDGKNNDLPSEPSFRKRIRLYKWQRQKKLKVSTADLQVDKQKPSSCSQIQRTLPAKLIDRGPMFYCSSFSSTTGLVSSHPLMKLNSSSDGAAALFELIFGELPTPSRSSPPILRALKRLIANAKRFRCGHLLRRHCPSSGRSNLRHLKFEDLKEFVDGGYTTEDEGSDVSPTSSPEQHTRPQAAKKDDHFSVSGPGRNFYKEESRPLPELLTMFSAQDQVVDFIWAACRRLVPEELLGSQKNWRPLTKHIATFVRLRRYETFSSRQCLHALKLSEFTIFSQTTVLEQLGYSRGQMLECWLVWLFSNVVVSLLRTFFYITESENQRQTVLFFRKPIWSKIQSLAVRGLCKTVYKRVDADGALKNRSLGFSKVRLLPKRNSIRPIANLGSASMYVVKRPTANSNRSSLGTASTAVSTATSLPSVASSSSRQRIIQVSHRRKSADLSRDILRLGKVVTSSTFKPVNLALADAHQCLKYEQETHPGYLGASVFGYNDIYMKLLPFIQRVRSCPSPPQFFLVVCDVAKAFDTIKHERLLEVIFQFVHEQQYFVQRFCSVSCRLATVRVLHERVCCSGERYRSFSDLATTLTSKRPESVFVDQVSCSNILSNQLLSILQEHITRNLLHIGPHFFQQVTGIPQGSVLSSLLCALYYGYLDTTFIFPLLQGKFHFRPEQRHSARLVNAASSDEQDMVASEQSLLLRLVDDSLFISTSEAKASHFLNIMHTGLKEFGCFANPEKTATSFDITFEDAKSKSLKNVYQTEDGACFMRWGGLLINCHTLETQADYARYCGEHIRASLTVTRTQHQGLHLVRKMFQFMRPKCHPVFYDSVINSTSTTCLNAYQAFMICAMKFHAYVRALLPRPCNNAKFLVQAIRKTTRYTFQLIQNRMQAARAGSKVSLNALEMEWLGLSAFRKVLARKQSTHRQLVVLIEQELRLRKFKGFNAAPHLVCSTDEARSSMFASIKY